MATITIIIILLFWNPQRLLNYYFDDTKKTIAEIEKNKNLKNVD
jgi:hypothetical protein